MQNIGVEIQTEQQCIMLPLNMFLLWAYFKIDLSCKSKM